MNLAIRLIHSANDNLTLSFTYTSLSLRNPVMLKTKSTTLLLSCIALFFSSLAQDNIGISGSNHSPTQTMLLNPSSIVDSKAYIDINLAGLSVYFHNNAAYLTKGGFNFLDQIKNPETIPGFAFNMNRMKYYGLIDVGVQGPSATFQIKKSAFGIYTGARSVTDLRGVPSEAINFGVYGWNYAEQVGNQYTMNNLKVNSLNWVEIGLTYGKIVSQNGYDLVTVGGSLKRLIGGAGGSIHLDQWSYALQDSDLQTFTLSGEYGFNYPEWNAGRGWGADIGFTWKRTLSDVTNYVPYSKQDGCKSCDYKFKFSAALVDIGRIRFDPPFYVNSFNEIEGSEWIDFSATSAEGVDGLEAEIENGLGLSSEAGPTKFNMWTPMAVTAQFDYNLGYNFFINSTLVAGAPWNNAMAPQRGSQLAVTPRFEINRLEAAIPVTLHEFKYPTVGAMLRLNSIIIGTDNLGAYFFNQDVYGADFYFNIKYTIFKSRKCKKVKEKPVKLPKMKDGFVPCPKW